MVVYILCLDGRIMLTAQPDSNELKLTGCNLIE